ncbi:uncharacterized protein LOC135116158 [Scylla paramamosain]|uniref:uncharacterized protein LOC135116158 n=1 Tax=Scylla paramamosain TaxID=85552 RepID=UPI0030828333
MADKEPRENGATPSTASVALYNLVREDHVRMALTADKGAAANIISWKVVDFTKRGDNYLCLVTSVEVQYVLDGRSSEVVYVVKINSGKMFGGESFLDLVFEKESKFYLELAPQINSVLKGIGRREINIPKCFHASLEKGKEIIILEDLRTKGYKMTDRKRGLDKAHTTLVVQELARLHAASLLLQSKTPGGDLGEQLPYMKKGLSYLMRNYNSMLTSTRNSAIVAQNIMNKVGGYERVTAWIETIIPKLVDIFYEQMECGEPKVVCHGDCWNNNLLFRYSEAGHPEDVMLVDLQLSHHAPPATDLNYLLFSSMTGDVRKPNIEHFLGSYHRTFSNIMEGGGQTVPFTPAQLLKDFRDRNTVGSILAMIFVPLVLFETEKPVDSTKDSEDLNEILLEARENSMKTLDTNPLIKSRYLSVFDELLELGTIP